MEWAKIFSSIILYIYRFVKIEGYAGVWYAFEVVIKMSVMDLSRIKKIIRQNGDKVILVEHDEPEMVMMSFAEYEKLVSREESEMPDTQNVPHIPEHRIERVQPIHVEQAGFRETEFIGPSAVAISDAFLRPEEIRLEDLPL